MPILPENRDKYPLDWPEISDRIRFERAGECGVEHGGRCFRKHGDMIARVSGGCMLAAEVVLTTGHLDHKPENCADENLRAWCQGCHNRYDGKDRAEGIKRRAREAMEREGQGLLFRRPVEGA